jgi:hypothetical protein
MLMFEVLAFEGMTEGISTAAFAVRPPYIIRPKMLVS